MRMKHLLLFALLLNALVLPAQKVRRDQMSAVTIRGNLGAQKPLTSAQFRKSFAGLFQGNLSVNARIAGGFSAGLGYQNTNFKNNEKLRYVLANAELPYRTSLLCDGVFVRLGYDQFFRTNFFVSYSLLGGYNFCKYTNVNTDTSRYNLPIQSVLFNATFVQPEVAINFVMEPRLAFSFFFSQTTMLSKYDARAPRLNHFPEINESGGRFPMTWFAIGFGFTVLLGK